MIARIKKKHLHTFERMDYGSYNGEFYRCIDPDCAFYTHREALIGKRALCTCMREYILTFYHLRRKKPNCNLCKEAKMVERHPEKLQPVRDARKELEARVRALFKAVGAHSTLNEEEDEEKEKEKDDTNT